jgi:hypothetical protein
MASEVVTVWFKSGFRSWSGECWEMTEQSKAFDWMLLLQFVTKRTIGSEFEKLSTVMSFRLVRLKKLSSRVITWSKNQHKLSEFEKRELLDLANTNHIENDNWTLRQYLRVNPWFSRPPSASQRKSSIILCPWVFGSQQISSRRHWIAFIHPIFFTWILVLYRFPGFLDFHNEIQFARSFQDPKKRS